jgi:hypothetical protein
LYLCEWSVPFIFRTCYWCELHDRSGHMPQCEAVHRSKRDLARTPGNRANSIGVHYEFTSRTLPPARSREDAELNSTELEIGAL